MAPSPTSPKFFEAMYRRDADPWRFATDTDELRRYAAIIAALHHRCYKLAYEPGCSVGVLTEGLAGLCDTVLAVDVSATAVERARMRTSHLTNVQVCCGSVEDALPDGVDLLVLSEIGYYFPLDEWSRIAASLSGKLPSGATLLASHWLGHSADHITHGDQVHDVLRRLPGLRLLHHERHGTFRLDRWERL